MLQGFYDYSLSHCDIIVQDIRRDNICMHTKGSNCFLDGRYAKNTKCVMLLTKLVVMPLNSNHYPQEEGLRYSKPTSEILIIIYTEVI
jgi:hypothetical protein